MRGVVFADLLLKEALEALCAEKKVELKHLGKVTAGDAFTVKVNGKKLIDQSVKEITASYRTAVSEYMDQ